MRDGNEVPNLLVGGYAVAFHGYVRYTKVLDVFVENSPETAVNLVKVFREFGLDSPQLTEDQADQR